MTIKEAQTRIGSLTSYIGYILLLAGLYFLENRFTSVESSSQMSPLITLADWVFLLLIAPLLMAGIFGGIYELQRAPAASKTGGFFHGIKTHALRLLGANLLYILLLLLVALVTALLSGVEQSNLDENKLLQAFIYIPLSAITLFWFTAIIVDRKVLRSLFSSIKILFTNPLALGLGIAWGIINYADNGGIDFPGGQTSLAVDGIRAIVLASIRVLAAVYAFAIYRQSQGDAFVESVEEEPLPENGSNGEGLAKASVWFTFVSFLPILNFVPLVLGILALRRKKEFALGPVIACCMGAFFTLFYFLILAGWLIRGSTSSLAPGYAFLSESNADLQQQVDLLESGSYQEVLQQLDQNTKDGTATHWTWDTTLALAKYQAYDREGALKEFATAAKKNPERGEFYYYYGLVLLENDQQDLAARQFQAALAHDPSFESAQRYLELANSTYTPSKLVSGIMFVFILLMMFTLHEFGHAFAAWKLGDDTAQRLGRLTLNPIPHLDLLGSIILPALLLWQGSEFLFGWAKPVPVNPANLKNPKRDHMRVSFAGPAMNLLVCMICFLILGVIILLTRLFWPETLSLNLSTPSSSVSLIGPPFARVLVLVVIFLKQLFYTSLILGIFNLIPIPPLDGSWILSGMLPQGFQNVFEKIRPFGFMIFLLLVYTSALNSLMSIPVGLAWGVLQIVVNAAGLG
jgi:Zn-dependent protease